MKKTYVKSKTVMLLSCSFVRKKRFVLLLQLLLITGIFSVSKADSYSILFDENNYLITTDKDGFFHISKYDGLDEYPEPGEAALPLSSFNIAIDGKKELLTYTPTFSKRLIKSDVVVAQSTSPKMLNDTISAYRISDCIYLKDVYPFSNCWLSCTSEWANIKILHYSVCPFVYDASKRELYFIDKIDLSITMSEDSELSYTNSKASRTDVADKLSSFSSITDYYADADVLKAMVSNPEDVDGILANTQSGWPTGPRIDYLVITSQALKESFEPLVNWKHAKGLFTKIVTIEEIENRFRGYDTQFAIKSYLYELYHINSLKYVLLGGDDTVVPVRQCYGNADPIRIDYTIPTDMYYACFGGDLSWDGNNNGVYGETDDNINLAQSIYVTRLPIRTSNDVEAYVRKLIAYERNPLWTNKLLFCGNKLHGYHPETLQSDAERRGEVLYSNFIEEFWQGERYRLFDTYTDFPGGADYDFTAVNLTDQLAKGYAFVDIATHGSQTGMTMEKDPYYQKTYNSNLGSEQVNSGYSIVTFVGCLTNAFDTSDRKHEGTVRELETCLDDPCLSESLIRNPLSGVVAYLGGSRETWEVELTPPDFGTAGQYITYFYKHLFSPQIEEKNFGRIVVATKSEKMSWNSHDGYDRWELFGLNPIGDPEMPIYTNEPKTFDNTSVTFGSNSVNIDTGVPGCRVCLMSRSDNGLSYYRVFEDTQLVTVWEATRDLSICITKQGYMPRTYGISYELDNRLENKISECSKTNSNIFRISLQLESNAISSQIIVSDLNGNIENAINVTKGCSDVTIDLNSSHSGIHIVSLVVNGECRDSIQLIKD